MNCSLPGMTKDCVLRANGYQIVTFDAPARVENEDHQKLGWLMIC